MRHEGVGLGMADGWARHMHSPGVATATCGPGVTQLATALVTAARAESPVVAFVGEHPANDQDYHQRLNQAAFAAGCETGFIRLATPEFADEAVRRAFYLAKLESRARHAELSRWTSQQETWEDDEPYKPSATLSVKRAVATDTAALEQAADIIAKAKKPVIIVGRGAIWSGAGDAVLKVGERIGGLIATSLRAKTWLADKTDYHAGVSGLYATRAAMQLFEEADCVIGVGASLNRHTTEHGYLYPNAKYVHLDPKPHIVMGMGRAADVYVQSDAKAGLELLDAAAGQTRREVERLPHRRDARASIEHVRGPRRVHHRAGHDRPSPCVPRGG